MKRTVSKLAASALAILTLSGSVLAANDPSSYNKTVTRAEFVSAISGFVDMNTDNAVMVYTDVPADSPVFQEVFALNEKGIIKGTGNGEFNPSGEITYAQAFTMAARLMTSEEEINAVGGYPLGGAAICTKLGITRGVAAVLDDRLTVSGMETIVGNIHSILTAGQDQTDVITYEGVENIPQDVKDRLTQGMPEDQAEGVFGNIISEENIWKGDAVPTEYQKLLSEKPVIIGKMYEHNKSETDAISRGLSLPENLEAQPFDLSLGTIEFEMPPYKDLDDECYEYESVPLTNHGGAILIEYIGIDPMPSEEKSVTIFLQAYNKDVQNISFRVGKLYCQSGEKTVALVTGLRADRDYLIKVNSTWINDSDKAVIRVTSLDNE